MISSVFKVPSSKAVFCLDGDWELAGFARDFLGASGAPKKEVVAALLMQPFSSFASRSSSSLSARLRYLLMQIRLIPPCCSLLESAEEVYFIEKRSAFASFLLLHTVAVTNTLTIFMVQDRTSFSLAL